MTVCHILYTGAVCCQCLSVKVPSRFARMCLLRGMSTKCLPKKAGSPWKSRAPRPPIFWMSTRCLPTQLFPLKWVCFPQKWPIFAAFFSVQGALYYSSLSPLRCARSSARGGFSSNRSAPHSSGRRENCQPKRKSGNNWERGRREAFGEMGKNRPEIPEKAAKFFKKVLDTHGCVDVS